MIIIKPHELKEITKISHSLLIDKNDLIYALEEAFIKIILENLDKKNIKEFEKNINILHKTYIVPYNENIIIGLIILGEKLKIDISITKEVKIKDILDIFYFLKQL